MDCRAPFQKPYRLLAIGRFARTKGFPELLTAMARLRDDGFPVRLTLVGDGNWKRKLVDMRKRYQSDGSPEKALLPCEGSPRALLCAVPIIAAGDVTGSVGLLTEDRTAQPDAAQLKAVNVAAAFLAKQMEE